MTATEKDLKRLRWAYQGAREQSTCSRRQYMALIYDQWGHLIGQGYNGSPAGMEHCTDGGCPRVELNPEHGASYGDCISVHAEVNAIVHSDWSERKHGCTLYVTGTPCWDCSKVVTNSGISRLVFLVDDDRGWEKSRLFLETAGVIIVPVTAEELGMEVGAE